MQRCVQTGVEAEASRLLKCVVGPEDVVVPDLKQSLPGEAIWLVPLKSAVQAACKAGEGGNWPPDLPEKVAVLMHKRLVEALHLSRRSGELVGGFDKVRSALESGRAVALLHAGDAAEDGKRKLNKLARADEIAVIEVLSKDDFASVTGRENQSHLALFKGGLAKRIKDESKRLLDYEHTSLDAWLEREGLGG